MGACVVALIALGGLRCERLEEDVELVRRINFFIIGPKVDRSYASGFAVSHVECHDMRGFCSVQVPHGEGARVHISHLGFAGYVWSVSQLLKYDILREFGFVAMPCCTEYFPVLKCRLWLYSNAAYLIESSQWCLGSRLWWRHTLAVFMVVLLTLSPIPFSWGVWGIVVLWCTSCML